MRQARDRHADRLRERDPGAWGISAEILVLETSADISGRLGNRNKVVAARRSDAFTLLHQAKRYGADGQLEAGISDGQHRASQRYFTDWCERVGVKTVDAPASPIDSQTDGQGASQRMIDAGKRIAQAHAMVGRHSARLLQALVEPMVARGEIRPWRALVLESTRERDPHAQAGAVRMALENLRLAYEDLDGGAPRIEREPAMRVAPIRVWAQGEEGQETATG